MPISPSLSFIDNPSSGTVQAIGSLTNGFVVIGAGTSFIEIDSKLDDGVTTANTLTYTGIAGITATIFNATSAPSAYEIGGLPVLAFPFNDSTSLAVGVSALANQNAVSLYNVAVGVEALYSNTTGYYNVAVGFDALDSNTTGYYNVAVGYEALYSNTTGFGNVANGSYALDSNTTGYYNVAVGYEAGFSGTAITTGNSCVFVGSNAGAAGAADVNEIVIGASVVGAGSNTAVIGNASVTDVYFGSSTGVANIHARDYYTGATPGLSAGPFTAITSIQSIGGLVTTLTGTSDERLKTDIKPYARGLAAVLSLNPATYKWNEAGQKKTGFTADQEFAGFIAQDVQKAIPESVGQEGDYLSLMDRPILAALVNCIKELNLKIESLERRGIK